MLSTLTIVSIFTEIFIAGILIAGAITFFRRYNEGQNRVDAFFAFILLFFSLKIILTIVSQMAFNLGRPLSELIFVNRFIALASLAIIVLVWFFVLVKFKIKKVRWIKWTTVLLVVVALVVVFRIIISQISLVFRADVIEPLVSFSHPVPLKTLWELMWLALAGAYFWRGRFAKGGLRQLCFFGAFSAVLLVVAHIITMVYSSSGQSIYLLTSWIITLLGVTGLLLTELIPPQSRMAVSPLSFFRTRILFKLVLIMVVLIVILFEVTTLATIAIGKYSLSSTIVAGQREAAEDIRDEISQYLNDSLSSLRFMAGTPALRSEGGGQLAGVFRMFLDVNPNFNALMVISRSGQVELEVLRQGEKRVPMAVPREIFEAFSQDKQYVSFLQRGEGEKNVLNLAVPLGSSYRALAGTINLKYIEQLITDLSLRGGRVIYLVDDKGALIAHPDSVRARSRSDYSSFPAVASLLNKKEGEGEFEGDMGEKMVGAYVLVKGLNWGVVVEEPISTAYFPLRTLETNSLAFIICGMIITCVVGIFFARSIERPLKDVISGTEAIRKGDLSFRIPLETQDEVGELAQAFNQMTSELRESQDRLVLSEKLASLGTMAAGMAHEIKNPLVSLRTFTQLLPQKWQDPEYREKFAAIVPQEIERINKIAESLLKFGRPIKPELSQVDVNAVLEEIILLFESECKKNNIRVTTKFADLPSIVGDASQLSQAFVNIALNAIQVMQHGGELTFKTDLGEVVRLKRSYVPSSYKKVGEFGEMSWGEVESEGTEAGEAIPAIFVEISDTGEGIPEENLKSLFDPFFTTKVSGTGMGLPITLRIIEEHKGSVKVRSQFGKGTTFLVTLPQNLSQVK